jgi:hypothetical protein
MPQLKTEIMKQPVTLNCEMQKVYKLAIKVLEKSEPERDS